MVDRKQTAARDVVVAGIDIGTLTCRLLLATVKADGVVIPRDADRRILRLGEGVDRTKRLSAPAMARVVETLSAWRDRIASGQAVSTMVVATSAVREAENRQELLDLVKRETGFVVEILNGTEEAEYTLRGIRAGLPPDVDRFVGLDIGGGSTELMRAHGREIRVCSMDVGVVRLTERALPSDPPTEEAVRRLETVIRENLDAVASDFRWMPQTTLVGTAGTITTLAALAQRLPRYDPARIHNFVLDISVIRHLERELRARDRTARRSLPGLEPGREDVIVAGTILLRVIMEMLEFDRCLVSEYGLREGIVQEAARRAKEAARGS